ncbi:MULTISPECIES: hypothetical protein [unclassified Mesorhizobium]|uniref:hypothetical protein n=1 Tax=unclassified Mesorhizobium TaxID=325217 RepID=UPI000FDB733B|nr:MULTISPECIES: hypothetical protein [unclassified Mesorhizobium]TGQ12386.1 hypothetical protein EN862_016010 [Mesorhizobium sp. M2E.F.Ca.ET.219.01.1.1]TGT68207.1 hypothetical protein EN809_027280 [Mesorhizobium sp. M2E.F.Ca.ET.166.01.1.1]TGW01211.1 hypothetical protein EN797_012590 [Mesorhizobium sp. M2E.F.Ca.ET.154.01.1.1]
MADDETELATVDRHIVNGMRHIEHQRKVVARLRAYGSKTKTAEELLKVFEAVQETHIAHKSLLIRTDDLLRNARYPGPSKG